MYKMSSLQPIYLHIDIQLFITSAMTRINVRHHRRHRHCRGCSRCRGSVALIDCHIALPMRGFKNYRLSFLLPRRRLSAPLPIACVHIFLIARASASGPLALPSRIGALRCLSNQQRHFISFCRFSSVISLHFTPRARLYIFIYLNIVCTPSDCAPAHPA